MNNRVIGIIPARGGSRGVPNKNLRPLHGKPLLDYIVSAALNAQTIEKVYVSTDSEEIAQRARALGAQAIVHPTELSTDTSPTFGVIQNALNHLRRSGDSPDILVTMRPTSPLCPTSDIDTAVNLLQGRPDADAVISVVRSPIHPYRILRITETGELVYHGHTTERLSPQQRQSFETVYVRNGAIYASWAKTIDAGGLWGEKNLPYIMPQERSVNINEEIDFVLAEALLARV